MRTLLSTFVIGTVLLATACTSSLSRTPLDPIQTVQQATFPDEPAFVIGQTLKALSAPATPSWTTFNSQEGATVVEVTGTVVYSAQTESLYDLFDGELLPAACEAVGTQLAATTADVAECEVVGTNRMVLISEPFKQAYHRLWDEHTSAPLHYIMQFVMLPHPKAGEPPFEIWYGGVVPDAGPFANHRVKGLNALLHTLTNGGL